MVSAAALLGRTALEVRAHPGTAGSPLVIAVHQPCCTTVAVHFVLAAGAKFDFEDRAGLAHLAEHVVHSRGGPVSPSLARFDFAWTSSDSMVHGFRCAPGRLYEVVSAFGRFSAAPLIDPAAVDDERRIVLNELQYRSDRLPLTISRAEALRRHFDRHAYARPASGTTEGVSRCSYEDVREFMHERLRLPPQAVVLCGNLAGVDLDEVACRLAFSPSPLETDRPARSWTITEPVPTTETRFAHFVIECPLLDDPASPAVDTLVALLPQLGLGSLERAPLVYVKRVVRAERSVVVISMQLERDGDVCGVVPVVKQALASMPDTLARIPGLSQLVERRRVRAFEAKAIDHQSMARLVSSYASRSADPCQALAQAFETVGAQNVVDTARRIVERGALQCYLPTE